MSTDIVLRLSAFDELAYFSKLEKQPHAKQFINVTALQEHQVNYSDPLFRYLSIELEGGVVAGYFILVLEPNEDSVEFRRVIVDSKHRGIGQVAIARMEEFSETQLNASQIWLDVYEDNAIGKHIYEKLGYLRFNSEHRGARTLHYYEKYL